MGITDKLKGFSNNVQHTTKQAAHGLSHICLRLISGFFIGLVLSFIFQELFGLGNFMLVFLNILFASVIYKLLSSRTMFQIVIFDFICILIGALLRMYILIAPN